MICYSLVFLNLKFAFKWKLNQMIIKSLIIWNYKILLKIECKSKNWTLTTNTPCSTSLLPIQLSKEERQFISKHPIKLLIFFLYQFSTEFKDQHLLSNNRKFYLSRRWRNTRYSQKINTIFNLISQAIKKGHGSNCQLILNRWMNQFYSIYKGSRFKDSKERIPN